ncbi:MAG: hypothetical protein HYU36_21620 [Planctomycetes bacterium]|nr:hypothetical protein [Planctomycetota bacterium]
MTGETQEAGVLSRIARATFIILFIQIFWKAAGFLLNVLVAQFYGPSLEADAYYFVSENVIFLLQTLFLKVAVPVIVPLFKEQMGERGEEKAWEFLNTVINLVLVVQVLTMAAGAAYAPEFVALAGRGLNREAEDLAVKMMRWCMPGVLLISFTAVTYAVLNSYNEFAYMSAGDAVQKILWVLAFLALGILGHRDIDAIILSFLVGAVAGLTVHLIGLKTRLHFYRPGFPQVSLGRRVKEAALLLLFGAGMAVTGVWLARREVSEAILQAACASIAVLYLLLLWWRARRVGTVMAKFAALSVPLLIGILFAKYRDLFTKYYATFTSEGVFSDLVLARKVGELPNTLLAQAVGMAMLPYLSDLAQKKEWGEFAQVMTRTLKVMFLVFVPLTVATVVLRDSLIALLYDPGNWDPWHLQHAGDALGLYVLGLLFFAIENPLQQSFFSMQRMWTPTVLGFVGTGFHLLFLYLGIQVWGFPIFLMVALVYPVARIFKGLLLLGTMRAVVPILPLKSTARFVGQMAVACLAMGCVMSWSHAWLTRRMPLEPHRAGEVLLDTFNVEARGWVHDNLDEFEVVPRPDEEGGGHCLSARIVPSPRRQAALLRNIRGLALRPDSALSFEVKADSPVRIRVQVIGENGERSATTRQEIPPGNWHRVRFEMPDAPPGVRWNWFRIWAELDGAARRPVRLGLDDLALGGLGNEEVVEDMEATARGWERWGAGSLGDAPPLEVVDVDRDRCVAELVRWGLPGEEAGSLARQFPERAWQQSRVVEWMDRRHHPALGSPAEYLRAAILGDRPPPEEFGDPPRVEVEYALLLDRGAAGSAGFIRSLRAYSLAGLTHLTFKAKSERKTRLQVTLESPGGSISGEVEIQVSAKRKVYEIPLSRFVSSGGSFSPDLASVLRFSETGGRSPGRLWLDNVGFVRPVRRLPFEALKVLHCALPSLLGAVVFLMLLKLLRVEEARDIAQWLREKVARRFRRRT